ncbi:unnamed protein product [Sympodiomycopsis kandeliae]
MSSAKKEAVEMTTPAGEIVPGTDGPSTIADRKRTRRILRQVDLRVLPLTLLLYGISYADRAAIGNARAAGLMKDLSLSDGEYAFATSIFFVFYALFEVPANVCLQLVGARIWLPLLALSWGICQMCIGFVQNFAGLSVARVFLGIAEAGILPGVMATMSILYPPSAIQARYGALLAFNSLVSAFAGLLAYALVHKQTFEGWRWLFIVEGLITIALAVPAYMTIRSSVEQVTFLSKADQVYLMDRLEWDQGRKETMETNLRRRHIVAAFQDVKYFSFFVSSAAAFSSVPSCLALVSQNLAGRTKRTAGVAIVISVGGLGSILACNIARNKDAPVFAVAYKINIAMCGLCAIGAGGSVLWLRRANQIKAEDREASRLTEEELADLGDDSPFYVYRF